MSFAGRSDLPPDVSIEYAESSASAETCSSGPSSQSPSRGHTFTSPPPRHPHHSEVRDTYTSDDGPEDNAQQFVVPMARAAQSSSAHRTGNHDHFSDVTVTLPTPRAGGTAETQPPSMVTSPDGPAPIFNANAAPPSSSSRNRAHTSGRPSLSLARVKLHDAQQQQGDRHGGAGGDGGRGGLGTVLSPMTAKMSPTGSPFDMPPARGPRHRTSSSPPTSPLVPAWSRRSDRSSPSDPRHTADGGQFEGDAESRAGSHAQVRKTSLDVHSHRSHSNQSQDSDERRESHRRSSDQSLGAMLASMTSEPQEMKKLKRVVLATPEAASLSQHSGLMPTHPHGKLDGGNSEQLDGTASFHDEVPDGDGDGRSHTGAPRPLHVSGLGLSAADVLMKSTHSSSEDDDERDVRQQRGSGGAGGGGGRGGHFNKHVHDSAKAPGKKDAPLIADFHSSDSSAAASPGGGRGGNDTVKTPRITGANPVPLMSFHSTVIRRTGTLHDLTAGSPRSRSFVGAPTLLGAKKSFRAAAQGIMSGASFVLSKGVRGSMADMTAELSGPHWEPGFVGATPLPPALANAESAAALQEAYNSKTYDQSAPTPPISLTPRGAAMARLMSPEYDQPPQPSSDLDFTQSSERSSSFFPSVDQKLDEQAPANMLSFPPAGGGVGAGPGDLLQTTAPPPPALDVGVDVTLGGIEADNFSQPEYEMSTGAIVMEQSPDAEVDESVMWSPLPSGRGAARTTAVCYSPSALAAKSERDLFARDQSPSSRLGDPRFDATPTPTPTHSVSRTYHRFNPDLTPEHILTRNPHAPRDESPKMLSMKSMKSLVVESGARSRADRLEMSRAPSVAPPTFAAAASGMASVGLGSSGNAGTSGAFASTGGNPSGGGGGGGAGANSGSMSDSPSSQRNDNRPSTARFAAATANASSSRLIRHDSAVGGGGAYPSSARIPRHTFGQRASQAHAVLHHSSADVTSAPLQSNFANQPQNAGGVGGLVQGKQQQQGGKSGGGGLAISLSDEMEDPHPHGQAPEPHGVKRMGGRVSVHPPVQPATARERSTAAGVQGDSQSPPAFAGGSLTTPPHRSASARGHSLPPSSSAHQMTPKPPSLSRVSSRSIGNQQQGRGGYGGDGSGVGVSGQRAQSVSQVQGAARSVSMARGAGESVRFSDSTIIAPATSASASAAAQQSATDMPSRQDSTVAQMFPPMFDNGAGVATGMGGTQHRSSTFSVSTFQTQRSQASSGGSNRSASNASGAWTAEGSAVSPRSIFARVKPHTATSHGGASPYYQTSGSVTGRLEPDTKKDPKPPQRQRRSRGTLLLTSSPRARADTMAPNQEDHQRWPAGQYQEGGYDDRNDMYDGGMYPRQSSDVGFMMADIPTPRGSLAAPGMFPDESLMEIDPESSSPPQGAGGENAGGVSVRRQTQQPQGRARARASLSISPGFAGAGATDDVLPPMLTESQRLGSRAAFSAALSPRPAAGQPSPSRLADGFALSATKMMPNGDGRASAGIAGAAVAGVAGSAPNQQISNHEGPGAEPRLSASARGGHGAGDDQQLPGLVSPNASFSANRGARHGSRDETQTPTSLRGSLTTGPRRGVGAAPDLSKQSSVSNLVSVQASMQRIRTADKYEKTDLAGSPVQTSGAYTAEQVPGSGPYGHSTSSRPSADVTSQSQHQDTQRQSNRHQENPSGAYSASSSLRNSPHRSGVMVSATGTASASVSAAVSGSGRPPLSGSHSPGALLAGSNRTDGANASGLTTPQDQPSIDALPVQEGSIALTCTPRRPSPTPAEIASTVRRDVEREVLSRREPPLRPELVRVVDRFAAAVAVADYDGSPDEAPLYCCGGVGLAFPTGIIDEMEDLEVSPLRNRATAAASAAGGGGAAGGGHHFGGDESQSPHRGGGGGAGSAFGSSRDQSASPRSGSPAITLASASPSPRRASTVPAGRHMGDSRRPLSPPASETISQVQKSPPPPTQSQSPHPLKAQSHLLSFTNQSPARVPSQRGGGGGGGASSIGWNRTADSGLYGVGQHVESSQFSPPEALRRLSETGGVDGRRSPNERLRQRTMAPVPLQEMCAFQEDVGSMDGIGTSDSGSASGRPMSADRHVTFGQTPSDPSPMGSFGGRFGGSATSILRSSSQHQAHGMSPPQRASPPRTSSPPLTSFHTSTAGDASSSQFTSQSFGGDVHSGSFSPVQSGAFSAKGTGKSRRRPRMTKFVGEAEDDPLARCHSGLDIK